MSITDHIQYRLATKLVAVAILTVPLAACTGNETNTGSSAVTSAGSASSALNSAASAASSAANKVGKAVDCSGTSCSVTLSSDAKQADVLGTTISFNGVQGGKATLRVGDHDVSCAQGDKVSAGPLALECTTVSDSSVTLTASLG